MHEAHNEEEALELLFVGDTNRAIAETPMNMVSQSVSQSDRQWAYYSNLHLIFRKWRDY